MVKIKKILYILIKLFFIIIFFFILFPKIYSFITQNSDWYTYRGNNERQGYSNSNFDSPLMEIFRINGNGLFTSPVGVKDNLFLGCGDKYLYCLDKKSGKILWTYVTNSAIIGSPSYYDGKIYFGTVDGIFYCIDVNNPNKYLWRFVTYSKIFNSPLINNDIVFFSADNGYVYALNANNGKEVWNSFFDTKSKIYGTISGDSNSIFFITIDGYLYSLDQITGKLNFKKTLNLNTKSTPVIKDDFVYVLTYDGQLIYFNKYNGNYIGSFLFGENSNLTPAISNEYIALLSNNGKLTLLYKNNLSLKWSKNLSGFFDTSPIITDKYIFVGNNSSTLYMVSIDNGAILWYGKFENGFHTDFCISEDILYTVTKDSKLIALTSEPPPAIKIEPDEIDFGEVDKYQEKKSLSFKISNKGGRNLIGKIEVSDKWIEVIPSEFILKMGSDITVNVTIYTKYFEEGKEYNGKIFIKSNGGDIDIPIKVKSKLITPKINVLQKKIDLGSLYKGIKKEIIIYIKNSGGGELEITKILTSVYWLEIPTINNLKGNDLEIKIIVNTEKLETNKNYNGKINIRSNGGDEEVEINFYCIENLPKLYIDKDFIDFGEIKKGVEISNFFVISNIGGGTLSGTIVSDSWIILDKTSFIGNEFKIFFKIDSSKLNEGESYKGKIEIISNGGNKTLEIYIKLNKVNKIVITLQIGNKIMIVNGVAQEIDTPPQIIEGRTYLPIRYVVEPLGADVIWDGNEKKVTIILKDIIIELWIGKNVGKVNGTYKPIDSNNPKVVPLIINGRTMLPIRFVAENLGCKVDWEPNSKTITITYLGD